MTTPRFRSLRARLTPMQHSHQAPRGNGTASTPAPPVVAKVIRHHLTFKVNARRLAAQNVILFLIPDVVLGADGAMRRREYITLLGSAAAVWPLAVTAQSPSRVYRVGSLITGSPIADDSPSGAALIRGLAEHGYVLNRNLMFEHRGAEMQLDRLPRLVDGDEQEGRCHRCFWLSLGARR